MTKEFKLPDIGEGIAEGEIVKWHVAVGDNVNEDQTVAEVMTDKVTAEIPSPFSGVVKELLYKEGDTVNVGDVFIILDEASSGSSSKKEASEQEENNADKTVSNGKASTAVAEPPSSRKPAPTHGAGGKVLAAPATRKLARELGIDLSSVSGSGVRGRITRADLESHSGDSTTAPSSNGNTSVPCPLSESKKSTSKPAAVSTPKQSKPTRTFNAGQDERVPFAGMRRKIAEHLVKSKQSAPHFGYVDEVDVSALVAMRKELKESAAEQDVKLTYLPFIIKAVIAGLKQYPVLNAQLDESANEIVYKGDINMGIAVATDDGLIVPVIKHADQKSLLELARDIQDLSEKARTGKLALDDIQGGTFTLTSIGSIGGMFGLPIINQPEVGIIGINKIQKRPVVVDDDIVIRDVMYLSISGDHRVVDGAECAMFMNTVIAHLTSPSKLLLV